MSTLVFAAGELQRLRQSLLADAPLETAAFLLARPVQHPDASWRLIIYETIELLAEDYVVRTPTAIELPPAVVARVMQRARADGASIVAVHTHPADRDPAPSSRDLRGEERMIPAFVRRVNGVPHARLILSAEGEHAALVHLPGDDGLTAEMRVTEVGPTVYLGAQNPLNPAHRAETVDSATDDSRPRAGQDIFERQVLAFGHVGQARLRALRVGIVGLGGTGSVVLQQLAHLGVGDFTLVDPDLIETTNLNRVVGSTESDVGRPKVDVAADLIRRIQESARIRALRGDVRDAETARVLLETDFFFGCTDSQGSRAVMSQLAYQYLVPGIDLGVGIRAQHGQVSHISGRVQMLAPGLACLLCSGVLDPEAVRRDLLTDEARAADQYIPGEYIPQPAVISINSAAASLAVTMFLSAMVGIPVASRHQRLRLETGVISNIDTTPTAGCPWCSASGALSRGDAWPAPGRGRVSAVESGA